MTASRVRLLPSIPARVGSLLRVCTWPSEAYWRTFELAALDEIHIRGPVLELGCGDGAFTELAGVSVDQGIDLNPRAVAKARLRTHVYGSVRVGDVRHLAGEFENRFETVFANSVLEHINGLEGVLSACFAALRPGGSLIATVPLVDMNRHLLLRQAWYHRLRGKQLCHHNLWSLEHWGHALERAGFEQVETHRYLEAQSCRYWDLLDAPAALGIGRFRLAPILRRVAALLLPLPIKIRLAEALATGLSRHMSAGSPWDAHGCAALLIATKKARAAP